MRGDGYNRLNSTEQGQAKGKRTAISQKTRYLVFQKSQFRCRACGRGADDGVKLVVERRIEALFDCSPNQDIPSLPIQLVSGNALDWHRAPRRLRERTGKNIQPVQGRRAYRYFA